MKFWKFYNGKWKTEKRKTKKREKPWASASWWTSYQCSDWSVNFSWCCSWMVMWVTFAHFSHRNTVFGNIRNMYDIYQGFILLNKAIGSVLRNTYTLPPNACQLFFLAQFCTLVSLTPVWNHQLQVWSEKNLFWHAFWERVYIIVHIPLCDLDSQFGYVQGHYCHCIVHILRETTSGPIITTDWVKRSGQLTCYRDQCSILVVKLLIQVIPK